MQIFPKKNDFELGLGLLNTQQFNTQQFNTP